MAHVRSLAESVRGIGFPACHLQTQTAAAWLIEIDGLEAYPTKSNIATRTSMIVEWTEHSESRALDLTVRYIRAMFDTLALTARSEKMYSALASVTPGSYVT